MKGSIIQLDKRENNIYFELKSDLKTNIINNRICKCYQKLTFHYKMRFKNKIKEARFKDNIQLYSV